MVQLLLFLEVVLQLSDCLLISELMHLLLVSLKGLLSLLNLVVL